MGEGHKTVGLRARIGISNTNDKNAKLYTLLHLYSVCAKKGEARKGREALKIERQREGVGVIYYQNSLV